MLEWLVPIGLFWLVGAVYLGGFALEFEGDSPIRQVGGLLATFAAFLAAWAGLRLALGGMGIAGRVILPTLAVIAGYGLLARLGFRLMGVKIRKVRAQSH